MTRFALVLVAVLYCASSIYARPVNIKSAVKGWYWRDNISGKVPENALSGGIDSEGETTYVAQTVHYAGQTILPGAFVPKQNQIYYEYDRKQWKSDQSIKILCTQEPENFKWESGKKDQKVKIDDDYVLVPGGVEKQTKLGIGRVKIGSEVVQGKVIIENDAYELLHYNKDGKGLTVSEFEVLYYVKSGSGDCSNSGITININ